MKDRPRPERDAPKPVKRSLGGGAPPPRSRARAAEAQVAKPQLPAERGELPGSVYREIKRTARVGEVDDVANAVATAGEAMAEEDLDRAVELLEWAKSRAPRSTAVREGLGIAHYLRGDFEGAQRELQAYRRMGARADQNHLLADSARALGRPERVLELIEEMTEAYDKHQVPLDRLLEALIVQSGVYADAGKLDAALAVLERAPLGNAALGEGHARTWYAAGDLAERMGDRALAREYFEAVLTVEDDFLDAAERLEALS